MASPGSGSSYDLGVVEALKVTFPDFLQGYLTPLQWSPLSPLLTFQFL